MLPELFFLILGATTRLTTLQPSHLVLEGNSNLTHWRCRSTSLDALLEAEHRLDEINAAIDRIASESEVPASELPMPRFRLRIPIAEIRCGNRLMEREMRRALRGAEHPEIEFQLREIEGKIRHETVGRRYLANVAGDLTVAGATRRVRVEIHGWRLTPESFYVRAAVPLQMSDFGITPPTALFGLIRTRDEIRVYFDLRLAVRE